MSETGTTIAGGIIFVLLLLSAFFYLRTLQRALESCSPECRTTSPNSVWLMLIPLFQLIYQFFLVGHMSNSLRSEFTRRNIPDVDPEPGRSLGIAVGVLVLISFIPIVGDLTKAASFVCWILYWRKISGYARKLAMPLDTLQST